jgi:hypothetical protein
MDYPDWAIERAFRLSGYDHAKAAEYRNGSLVNGSAYFAALIRHVLEHEEPPVDPLLIEAREIAAENAGKLRHPAVSAIRAGHKDDDLTFGVSLALQALRRGMKLAKSETSNA